VLAHLPEEYKRLSAESRKREVRQVIKEVRLNAVSPHGFLLHVTWQGGIAACPDVALLWRGTTPNTGKRWTEEEDAIMRDLYPLASQTDVMQALPDRAWNRILERAQSLGLRRAIAHAGPYPSNVYHRTMSYSDLEAVAALVDEPQQQDRLRCVASDLATRTVRGGISAHWWFPLAAVSYAGPAATLTESDALLLSVSAVASGLRRRGGSPPR
jgi:hypothetical protein